MENWKGELNNANSGSDLEVSQIMCVKLYICTMYICTYVHCTYYVYIEHLSYQSIEDLYILHLDVLQFLAFYKQNI